MKILPIMLSLAALLCIWPSMGSSAAGVDIQFQWAPCPGVGEFGAGMGEAVQYLVWARRDGGVERVVAATADTFVTLNLVPDVSVEVCVQGIDAAGALSVKSAWSEPLYFEYGTGVGELPQESFLKPNFPNPFNPATTSSYRVPEDIEPGQPVDLGVFSVRGQKIRTLTVEPSPGWHEVRWDGRDDQGRQIPSGTYLTRFLAGAMVETGKMTLAK